MASNGLTTSDKYILHHLLLDIQYITQHSHEIKNNSVVLQGSKMVRKP